MSFRCLLMKVYTLSFPYILIIFDFIKKIFMKLKDLSPASNKKGPTTVMLLGCVTNINVGN